MVSKARLDFSVSSQPFSRSIHQLRNLRSKIKSVEKNLLKEIKYGRPKPSQLLITSGSQNQNFLPKVRMAAKSKSEYLSFSTSIDKTYPKLIMKGKINLESSERSHEMQQVLERIRKQANIGDFELEDLKHVDSNMRKHRSQAERDHLALHMMKVRMRMQEHDLEKITKNATKVSQEKDRTIAGVEQLQKNIKNMQAFEVHQDQKIQTYSKQISESKRSAEYMTKEVDRLRREISAKAKTYQENSERSLSETTSLNRLVSLNDGLKSQMQQLKEDNKLLQESGHRLQQQLLNDKRRHQQEQKRFINVIYKRNNYLSLLKKQRDHIATNQIFNYTEDEFLHFFQPELPTNQRTVALT